MRGHDVALWASTHERMDELCEFFAVHGEVMRTPYTNTYDHWLRTLRTLWPLTNVSTATEQWHTWAPDVLHINKQNLEDGLDLLHAAECSGQPRVCTIHITQPAAYLEARLGTVRDTIAHYGLSRFSGPIATVQERRRCELAEFLPSAQEVHAINNGVPLPTLPLPDEVRALCRRRYGISDEETLLVSVGRLEPQKRPLSYVEAAARMYERQPHLRFIWVGDGRLRDDFEAAITHARLEDVIQCVGWQQDVQPFYAAADLFLHVARFEGLPLALIEAMASGLPCIITQELLHDFEVIGQTHVAVLEDEAAIDTLIHSSEARTALGQAARDLVASRLSVDAMARQYEALYTHVIHGAAA